MRMRLDAIAVIVFFGALCFAQEHDALCEGGSGIFQFEFRNEAKVWVGGRKENGFNARDCQATLSWGKQSEIVASGEAQIDIDLLGAEFSNGEPVVAFSVRHESLDCCMTYKIYSLKSSSKPVRTITGGGYFSAADTDLDGDLEIWTDDSEAIKRIEGLALGEIEFIPAYVLRFDRGRLTDVSQEYQSFYDGVIAAVRSQADTNLLQQFKASDGKLQPRVDASAEELIRMHQLRRTKVQVLEIVWAYLYSGREQAAWHSLADMWPEQDAERIRKEITNSREGGMRSQLDGPASGDRHKKRKAPIYEQADVTVPQAIMMRVYPPKDPGGADLGKREVHVSLVVDAAGKVRSVKPLGITKKIQGVAVDASGELKGAKLDGEGQQFQELVDVSAPRWKFVPAFKNGRPVACQVRSGVWLLR